MNYHNEASNFSSSEGEVTPGHVLQEGHHSQFFIIRQGLSSPCGVEVFYFTLYMVHNGFSGYTIFDGSLSA